MFAHYFRLARPNHWIKNFFIFAPLIFSKNLLDWPLLLLSIQAFASFCFVSGAVYTLNDIFDASYDREHPVKRERPIAAGKVSRVQAVILASVLVAISVLLASSLDPRFQGVLGLYFVLNFLYSARLKDIVILDAMIVSAGFMLRVMAGAFVIDVVLSDWIIICTFFISLFLSFSKRRAELTFHQLNEAGTTRAVLGEYSISLVDQILLVSAAGALISYSLYTLADRTVRIFGTPNLIYTTIFVAYGIFRYLYLIHKRQLGENPTLLIFSDVPLLANIVLWIGTCVLIIYW
ncbi:MAG TPA: decaprenyl-phosphate phosphoribosyltransferase [Bacteroidota bacterium]